MTLASFGAFLKGLLPLIGPELVSLWNADIVPLLQGYIAKMGADEQVSANDLLGAATLIITAEAPKI